MDVGDQADVVNPAEQVKLKAKSGAQGHFYAMDLEEKQIDQALLTPTPRQINHRQGLWGACKWFTPLLLPFPWIGLALIYGCSLAVSLSLPDSGIQSPATVTQLDPHDQKLDPNIYRVHYSYTSVKGNKREDILLVTKAQYQSLHVGDRKRLKICQVLGLPLLAAPILDGKPMDNSLSNFMWGLVALSVSFNVLAFYVSWLAVCEQVRCRFLTRFGKPVIGKITGTELQGRGLHSVKYEYQPGSIPTVIQGRMCVTRDEWMNADKGTPVTILFNPEKPQQSLIYEFSQYRSSVEGME